jgi:hypothetical protein
MLIKGKAEMERPIREIAGDYFFRLGTHLPQQCASDEFYFLPRSETAIHHLNRLDDLNPDRIQELMTQVQTLIEEITSQASEGIEDDIDRELVSLSMRSVVREFEYDSAWRLDPTLYIKIPLIATDHILSSRDNGPDKTRFDLLSLLDQIPGFLASGVENLSRPSEIAREVAVEMVQDASDFYHREVEGFITARFGQDKELLSRNRTSLAGWQGFRNRLHSLDCSSSFSVGKEGLERILTMSLGYPRSPEEIAEIAQGAYQKYFDGLVALAEKIDSQKSWNEIITGDWPSRSLDGDLLTLYRNEVETLRKFAYESDLMTIPSGEQISVVPTPSYLHSLRATASYRSPLTGEPNGRGTFFITPGKDDLELISRHAPYLSAHETYPGHHLLDHVRLHHPNPARRQIESPLFYEGWACYVEQLLDEFGYVRDPRQKLVRLKRLLWRSLRAILDVELQTGRITLDQGIEKMRVLGFSEGRMYRQIRRYALTPGYQLCYFMGMYEIQGLRERYSSLLGLRTFHDVLLGGGELPFHLVEKRLARVIHERFHQKKKEHS